MNKMIGQTISKYFVLEELGAGGMGVVYLAEDTRLKRQVALKFLSPHLQDDPAAIERFGNEARSASALDHPNICTIYEIDEHRGNTFISMSFYKGRTLRDLLREGPLPLEKAITITSAICQGLDAAHRAGIYHRDIKPGNIIILDDGQVKIIDFGLSKLLGVNHITKSGQAFGTLGYMAPEQIENSGATDYRADLWAVTALFYEMICGRPAFTSDFEAGLVYTILNEDPPAPTTYQPVLPREIDRIIEKGLCKNSGARYQSAGEMLDDLQLLVKDPSAIKPPPRRFSARGFFSSAGGWMLTAGLAAILLAGFYFFLGQPAIAADPSLALLPMRGFAEAEGDDLWTAGMADHLLTNLQRIGGLKVISQASVRKFEGTEHSYREIAAELGVNYLIEASVYKFGGRIKINANLIDAINDSYLWGDTFEEELRDIYSLHAQMAARIAEEVQVKLSPREQELFANTREVEPEAYMFYLRGLRYLAQRNDISLQKAITFFEEALLVDSTFAEAYAGMAEAYNWASHGYLKLPPNRIYEKISHYAQKAMTLDSTVAASYLTRGIARQKLKGTFAKARADFARAVELSPNSAFAREQLGIQMLLERDYNLALDMLNSALELDPTSASIHTEIGWIYYFQRDYPNALSHYRQALELEPEFVLAQFNIGLVHLVREDYELALADFQKALSISEGLHWKSAVGMAYARMGKIPEAMAILDEIKVLYDQGHNVATQIASIYVSLNEFDEAFKWYFQSVADSSILGTMRDEPAIDRIRDDPRFQQLIEAGFFL